MNALTHQLWDCSRLVGLRDRLRCPACGAVGTWKPHGGWLDFKDERKIRRWMCKWCGHYVGPEGTLHVVMGPYAWAFVADAPDGATPQEAIIERFGVPRRQAPWYG